jgi:hypothetical protein
VRQRTAVSKGKKLEKQWVGRGVYSWCVLND